jgi:hypothetical protein
MMATIATMSACFLYVYVGVLVIFFASWTVASLLAATLDRATFGVSIAIMIIATKAIARSFELLVDFVDHMCV